MARGREGDRRRFLETLTKGAIGAGLVTLTPLELLVGQEVPRAHRDTATPVSTYTPNNSRLESEIHNATYHPHHQLTQWESRYTPARTRRMKAEEKKTEATHMAHVITGVRARHLQHLGLYHAARGLDSLALTTELRDIATDQSSDFHERMRALDALGLVVNGSYLGSKRLQAQRDIAETLKTAVKDPAEYVAIEAVRAAQKLATVADPRVKKDMQNMLADTVRGASSYNLALHAAWAYHGLTRKLPSKVEKGRLQAIKDEGPQSYRHGKRDYLKDIFKRWQKVKKRVKRRGSILPDLKGPKGSVRDKALEHLAVLGEVQPDMFHFFGFSADHLDIGTRKTGPLLAHKNGTIDFPEHAVNVGNPYNTGLGAVHEASHLYLPLVGEKVAEDLGEERSFQAEENLTPLHEAHLKKEMERQGGKFTPGMIKQDHRVYAQRVRRSVKMHKGMRSAASLGN